MSYKRIIPCLDINKGRVVKGVRFVNLIDAGDPVEIAKRYRELNADELVFLDISATSENRGNMLDVIADAATAAGIPITVGGGIRTVADIERILRVGASKVGINSAAIECPSLIKDAASHFGSERIVAAIDVKRNPVGGYDVYYKGGALNAGLDAVEWAVRCRDCGAGEILLTSMDRDGTKAGYDLEITKKVADAVGIPVIASGGAGSREHIYEALNAQGGADGALAASLFHFNEISIPELKEYLRGRGIPVRA